ncbi:hypothetical protein MLM_1570 [Mycobacterium lepraemurium]|nr:hypothetical protein MLM_1570 [Mycobacterium lepraemurium]
MKLGCAVVCSALLAAGLLTTGVCAASVAQADFCGAKEDSFSCTARLDAGPPTSAESAFIQSVRGHVPGRDTDLLVVGRTVCKMGSDSGRYVRQQVAQRLGTDTANAGQVMDAAEEYICPGVTWR